MWHWKLKRSKKIALFFMCTLHIIQSTHYICLNGSIRDLWFAEPFSKTHDSWSVSEKVYSNDSNHLKTNSAYFWVNTWIPSNHIDAALGALMSFFEKLIKWSNSYQYTYSRNRNYEIVYKIKINLRNFW